MSNEKEKDEVKKKKKPCPSHKVEFQGGKPSHSDFGCDNCEDDFEILPEDAGTGA